MREFQKYLSLIFCFGFDTCFEFVNLLRITMDWIPSVNTFFPLWEPEDSDGSVEVAPDTTSVEALSPQLEVPQLTFL
jgi:hypothetical protein